MGTVVPFLSRAQIAQAKLDLESEFDFSRSPPRDLDEVMAEEAAYQQSLLPTSVRDANGHWRRVGLTLVRA